RGRVPDLGISSDCATGTYGRTIEVVGCRSVHCAPGEGRRIRLLVRHREIRRRRWHQIRIGGVGVSSRTDPRFNALTRGVVYAPLSIGRGSIAVIARLCIVDIEEHVMRVITGRAAITPDIRRRELADIAAHLRELLIARAPQLWPVSQSHTGI